MKTRSLFQLLLFAVLVSSCNDERISLSVSQSSITMFVGDVYQIEAESSAPISYKTMDPWYATVDSEGTVKGIKTGKTAIEVSDGISLETVNVTVKSTYDLYPEMESFIGKSTNVLEGIFGDYNEVVSITSGNVNYKCYLYANRGKYSISFCFLTASNDTSKTIQCVYVYVPVTYENQLETYLWDRYNCYDFLNDVYYFCNHDDTADIVLEYDPDTRLYMIGYFPLWSLR